MIERKELLGKSDFSSLTQYSDLNPKRKRIAKRAELKVEQDKIVSLKTHNLSCFPGKSHFEDDRTQNYFVLQPIQRYLKLAANASKVKA